MRVVRAPSTQTYACTFDEDYNRGSYHRKRIRAIPVAIIGMNSHDMSEYIEFVADHLLQALGSPKHYNTINPFPFMEQLGMEGKTNFFERRVGEYAKAGVLDSAYGKQKYIFSLDDDF